MQRSARAARWVLLGGAVAAVVAGPSAPALAAGAPGALKTVTYLGYRFAVPAAWPVIRTTGASTACVRFDRHAIYLGDPGQNQDCPSGLLGTTEAILVQPAAGPVPGASSAEDQAVRRITVVSPGIEVTATYDTDRALVARILSSAGLPLPSSASQGRAVSRESTANAARRLLPRPRRPRPCPRARPATPARASTPARRRVPLT
jgi:hypothetical protein